MFSLPAGCGPLLLDVLLDCGAHLSRYVLAAGTKIRVLALVD